jgi:hypothetical protein
MSKSELAGLVFLRDPERGMNPCAVQCVRAAEIASDNLGLTELAASGVRGDGNTPAWTRHIPVNDNGGMGFREGTYLFRDLELDHPS